VTALGNHDENLKVCQCSIHEDRRECTLESGEVYYLGLGLGVIMVIDMD
jgi:hypothetical protein